ncbi:MAG: hypothetical protein ABSA86_10775 [Oryzomonas sp.]
MLKMALAMTMLVSSSTAFALNNSDQIQLNLHMSLQEGQQAEVKQLLEPMKQAGLAQEEYRLEQIGRQQQEQIKQKQYLQELLWEWQRRQDARELGKQRQRDMLMERQQSGLFQ